MLKIKKISIVLLCSLIILSIGCSANNKYNKIRKNYEETLEQIITILDINNINNSIDELQQKKLMEKMKKQLILMGDTVPNYKKRDYDNLYAKYNLIDSIVQGFVQWDQLNEEEKSKLKMKVIATKAVIKTNK